LWVLVWCHNLDFVNFSNFSHFLSFSESIVDAIELNSSYASSIFRIVDKVFTLCFSLCSSDCMCIVMKYINNHFQIAHWWLISFYFQSQVHIHDLGFTFSLFHSQSPLIIISYNHRLYNFVTYPAIHFNYVFGMFTWNKCMYKCICICLVIPNLVMKVCKCYVEECKKSCFGVNKCCDRIKRKSLSLILSDVRFHCFVGFNPWIEMFWKTTDWIRCYEKQLNIKNKCDQFLFMGEEND